MKESAELLKPADIAPHLGVTTRRVYQLIEAGALPAVRIGGTLRIPRTAWKEWIRLTRREALASLRLKPSSAAKESPADSSRPSLPFEGTSLETTE